MAEFTKLYENSYRSVNIGLVNQMKMIADGIDLDIHDVIDAAKTKPFGFKPFIPGPGVGGHCIPVDPFFISWISDKKKINSDFIKISHKVNVEVTDWTIDKIKKNISIADKKILIIGVSYKKDIDDSRESPVLEIFKNFNKKFKVDYYDTYIKKIKIDKNIHFSIKSLERIHLYDVVIIGTDHSNIDYNLIVYNSKKYLIQEVFLENTNLIILYLAKYIKIESI